MAPSLSWLSSLKASQLKALATATGLNSSGTKPFLISQLLAHLPHGNFAQHDNPKGVRNASKAGKPSYDIISIDMGIRNLAYCRLTSPSLPSASSPVLNGIPTITDWARISISQKTPAMNSNADGSSTKEAFDPQTYSHHAYNLITTLLHSTPSPPTHILIERQRYRSMGGSAVQEWTLRVNMFEAMIYAVLRTLGERGEWRGTVCPIAPAKVGRFWLGEGEGVDGGELKGKGGGKSARTKMAKVTLLEEWLRSEDIFRLEGRAKEVGILYLAIRKGRGKGKSGDGDKGSQIGKLDDLADCLLQAMAWIQWEQNRKVILDEGAKALDEILET